MEVGLQFSSTSTSKRAQLQEELRENTSNIAEIQPKNMKRKYGAV
jgi:hypothetical protein